MRVFGPEIIEQGDEVRVSARVEVDSAKTPFPDTLWFSFPAGYRAFVSDRLDGFAVALLPLAMTLGEDLRVEGVLSPRLFRGLEEYQSIQCGWKPTSFKPVKLSADRLEPASIVPSPPAVACSFSGGVDSFHTLWRHLPENEAVPKYRVSHCLMINGFDADTNLDDEGHFSAYHGSLEATLKRHGLELIVCRTNYMRFSDPTILKQSFGAMVTAPALVLGKLFSCFYVPSSYRFSEFFRDGSHLMLDHLVSTESMQTIHDSSQLNRPGKTAIISDWEATYANLRVCFNQTGFDEATGSIVNCGRCEKCIRTMTTLEILGRLDRYSTFTRTVGHVNVWMCNYGSRGARLHAREIMSLAWENGRIGTWLDYCVAIAVSTVLKLPRALARRVHLVLEERSEFYAVTVRRLFPRLRRRAYWIR